MTRPAACLSLSLVLAIAIPWLSCSSDAGPGGDAAIDGSVVRDDAFVPDAPVVDTGPRIGCKELVDCVHACPDLPCRDACKARGSSISVEFLTQLLACSEGALAGQCKAACPDPAAPDKACNDCIQAACLHELNTCQADAF